MDDPTGKGSGLRLALDVWRRRKWLAVAVFAGAFTALASAVTSLPDMYRSTATVLVERQQVPETLLRPSVMGEVETRLQTINEEILSRSRLSDLITQFDLYPDLRKRLPPEAVVQRMRRDIQLELKGVEQGGVRSATFAFTLSYQGRDPETVARVTNALVSLYVGENLKIRERQVTFLGSQLTETKKKLDEQERQAGDFKLRHMGELPQQVGANLAALERLNTQLRLNGERQLRAMDRREKLEKQLGEADSSWTVVAPESTVARIAKLKQELQELRTRFTDKYPEVARSKAEIAALERQLAADPSLSRLKDALGEADAELKALKSEEGNLRPAIAMYERRVEQAPKRQQELQELGRDYEVTKELYQSLLKRYEEAQLGESMEQGQKGEQLRVLESAIPSRLPAAPNRFRLVLVGLLLSLGLAAGAVVLAEHLDTSFHTVDKLRAFTKVPVLVSIPRIDTEADGLRLKRFSLAAASLVIGLALIAGATYYVAHGNEGLVGMLARGGS